MSCGGGGPLRGRGGHRGNVLGRLGLVLAARQPAAALRGGRRLGRRLRRRLGGSGPGSAQRIQDQKNQSMKMKIDIRIF